jgi:hypothetical protein
MTLAIPAIYHCDDLGSNKFRIFPIVASNERDFKTRFLGEESFELFTKFVQSYVKLQVSYQISNDGRLWLNTKTSTPIILDGKIVSPSPRTTTIARTEWDQHFEPVIAMHHSPMQGHYIILHQGREIHNRQQPKLDSAILARLPEPKFVQVGIKNVRITNTQPVIQGPFRERLIGKGSLRAKVRHERKMQGRREV